MNTQLPSKTKIQPLQKKVLLPEVRNVSQLPAVPQNQDIVSVYKDLNSDSKVQLDLQRQRQHLFIAVIAFTLLGLGLFMGTYLSKNRSVAGVSAFQGFSLQGTPTQAEHYQYDKSCYNDANGEQVCMTRTSQKKDRN